MDNKWVKSFVAVLVGAVALVALLYIGDLIAGSQDEEAYRLAYQTMFGLEGWATWLIIGLVITYLIYVNFADEPIWSVGTREVVFMAIGAVLYGVLWLLLTALYYGHYKDEPKWQPPLKVAAMLASVFTIIWGANKLTAMLPPEMARWAMLAAVVGILGFVLYKVGGRIATILELLKSFITRGHWYLMPLVVVLLTIGSLLVVAASSPLVAPFIYTLF